MGPKTIKSPLIKFMTACFEGFLDEYYLYIHGNNFECEKSFPVDILQFIFLSKTLIAEPIPCFLNYEFYFLLIPYHKYSFKTRPEFIE